MSFLGLFQFNAPMLPWVILGIEMLLGQSWSMFDFMGIAVGHLYYYLEDVYPIITQRRILKTPDVLKQLFDNPSVLDNNLRPVNNDH